MSTPISASFIARSKRFQLTAARNRLALEGSFRWSTSGGFLYRLEDGFIRDVGVGKLALEGGPRLP